MIITLKGGKGSGWYSPPKGTHSGKKHRAVGSGKAVMGKEVAVGALGMGIDKARTHAVRVVKVEDEHGALSAASTARRDEIASLLAQHPESVVELFMRQISVAKDQDAWVHMVGDIRDEPHKVAGMYDSMRLKMSLPSDFAAYAFHHEMGHALFTSVSTTVRATWFSKMRTEGFNRHTGYSKINADEAFSEAYAAYIESGGVAKSAGHSTTFVAVRDIIDGAASALQEEW